MDTPHVIAPPEPVEPATAAVDDSPVEVPPVAAPSRWLAWQAAVPAALVAAIGLLALMVWMDRYAGPLVVIIGIVAGLAARWAAAPMARRAAVVATIVGLAALWLLLPALVHGRQAGQGVVVAIDGISLRSFITTHYLGSSAWQVVIHLGCLVVTLAEAAILARPRISPAQPPAAGGR